MEERKWRLSNIPTFNDPWRKLMLNFTTNEEYTREIQKGLPFFAEEELSTIEERYRDNGMTRKDIMDTIRRKGWLIKEGTLKNYIQKSLVPPALRRIKTDKGMISLYPNDMIRHLNFVQYCLFVGKETDGFIKMLTELLSENDEAYLEMVAGEIKTYSEDSVFGGNGLMPALWQLDDNYYWEAVGWAEEAIAKAFHAHPKKKEKYLKLIKELRKIQGMLGNKTVELRKALRADRTPVPPDMLKRVLSDEKTDDGED
jgi:hypothetical protein